MVRAYKAARKAIESRYTGICYAYEKRDILDPDSKITSQVETEVLTRQPCRISYSRVQTSEPSETAAGIEIIAKLFIALEINLRPGSRVVVTQNGATREYTASGEVALYATHQEILLNLMERWA